jgi:hypothetical protein
VYKDPPDTLSIYSSKQNLKSQVFFDTWKPLLQDIQTIQEEVTKSYKRLWNNLDDLLEEFRMKVMPPIDDAPLAELMIVEVEEQREINHVIIEQFTEVNQ